MHCTVLYLYTYNPPHTTHRTLLSIIKTPLGTVFVASIGWMIIWIWIDDWLKWNCLHFSPYPQSVRHTLHSLVTLSIAQKVSIFPFPMPWHLAGPCIGIWIISTSNTTKSWRFINHSILHFPFIRYRTDQQLNSPINSSLKNRKQSTNQLTYNILSQRDSVIQSLELAIGILNLPKNYGINFCIIHI